MGPKNQDCSILGSMLTNLWKPPYVEVQSSASFLQLFREKAVSSNKVSLLYTPNSSSSCLAYYMKFQDRIPTNFSEAPWKASA